MQHAYKRLCPLTALSLVVFLSTSFAQQRNNAGLGATKRDFDATALTTPREVLLAGVGFLKGKAYVPSAATTALVYEYSNGKLTKTFNAPAPVLNSGGMIDMANDGTSLIGGSTVGLVVFDTNGKLVNSIIAKNGKQTLTNNPIAGAGLSALGSYRAVAFNPAGNGGKGSFFVGNSGTSRPILEIDLTGAILNNFPNLGWDCGGLVHDPRTGNLWCMVAPGTPDIIELDINAKLKPTGNKFSQPSGSTVFMGGMDGISGGDPNTYKSDFDIVVLQRLNGNDRLSYHRIHLHAGLLGTKEAFLEGSVNTATVSRGNLGAIGPIKSNDILRWRINPGQSKSNNFPAITLVSAGPDASKDGISFFPELRVMTPFSIPASNAVLFLPDKVGGTPAAVPIPSGILRCFEHIRLQSLYFDPASPIFNLVATNEIWVHSFDEASCNIVVEAVGNNSMNGNTSSGFWRIIHRGVALPIKEVTFDWQATRDPRQWSMSFDVGQANMADRFDAGNSTVPGCSGTYRNGSDVAVGLIYDNKNNPAAACVRQGNNSGYIGNIPGIFGGGGPWWRQLTFRFTNVKFRGTRAKPNVFEFDCDTDGGRGVTGAMMAGMVIKITLINNQILLGELRADPKNTLRSVAGF